MNLTKFQHLTAALTTLVVILFLIGHAITSLFLLSPNPDVYNGICDVMNNFWLIKIVHVIIFLFLIVHVVLTIALTIRKKKLNATSERKFSKKNAIWMLVTGIIMLFYMVFHIISYKKMPMPEGGHYEFVHTLFSIVPAVILNVLIFAVIFVHLFLAGKSAAESLGFPDFVAKRVVRVMRIIGILTFLAYAAVPIGILIGA